MKKLSLIVIATMILFSCAPVLRHDLMSKGTFNVPPSEIKKNPELYRGRLFILGGIIVKATATKEGSLLEAIYVPVDSLGYLKNLNVADGRFLALYNGLLDPLIFRKNRAITLAGKFIETRRGKIDEMEYTYPLFEIEELYLWAERKEYYILPPHPRWYYYPPWRYDPWWYDPWWYGYY